MADIINIQPSDYSVILKRSYSLDLKPGEKNHRFMLSPQEIEEFAKLLGTDTHTLIWGTPEEREEFVKLILLGVIANGCTTTPVRYDDDPADITGWALKQNSLPAELRIDDDAPVEVSYYQADDSVNGAVPSQSAVIGYSRNAYLDSIHLRMRSFFEKEYGFFYDKDVRDRYAILKSVYDPELEELSNYLLEQLMCDYSFAESFLRRFTTLAFNEATAGETSCNLLEERIFSFLNHKGQYGDLALDYGEYDFYLFINAFDKFWDRHGKEYLSFFNEEVFSDDLYDGLKRFQDKRFDEVVKSSRLLNIAKKASLKDEYIDNEAYMTRMMRDQLFHYELEKARMVSNNSYTDLTFGYTSEVLQKTKATASALGFDQKR